MTNLKTHAPALKKRAKEHGKHKNVLKPMHLCTKTKRNLKTHIKYNVFAMTNLKTHVRYNVFAMINLKTLIKYNVFAMTNLKTHAPVHKKQAKGHGKQQNVLKPMRLCTKTKRKSTRTRNHPDTRTREAQR